MADGTVTFAEYERAVLATIACGREGGLSVTQPQLDASGTYYSYTFSMQGADDDTLLAIHDACYEEYLSSVDFEWAAENELSGRELAEEVQKVRSCLAGAGFATPNGVTPDELFDLLNEEHLPDEAVTCYFDSVLFAR